MTRPHGKNPRLIALASLTLIIGTALLLWGALSFRRSSPASFIIHHSPLTIISTASFAQPQKYPCPIEGDFKEVDIPVGLLCDYYEHRIEHAPPRDPSGVMQKRERFYAAPHDPFELLASVATAAPTDKAFTTALSSFRSEWEAGKSSNDQKLNSLDEAAAQSSRKSDALIDAGRAMNWLSGDEAAVVFFHAGLTKAAVEYARARVDGETALSLLHALDQTKALWRVKHYVALEGRFMLAARLNSPGSPEQRRAGYLYADTLYYQEKYSEAARAICGVLQDDTVAGDLGSLERSDISEMNWTTGFFLMRAGRFEEAAPYLHRVTQVHCEHTERAYACLVQTLVALGKPADAWAALRGWRAQFGADSLWAQSADQNIPAIRGLMFARSNRPGPTGSNEQEYDRFGN